MLLKDIRFYEFTCSISSFRPKIERVLVALRTNMRVWVMQTVLYLLSGCNHYVLACLGTLKWIPPILAVVLICLSTLNHALLAVALTCSSTVNQALLAVALTCLSTLNPSYIGCGTDLFEHFESCRIGCGTDQFEHFESRHISSGTDLFENFESLLYWLWHWPIRALWITPYWLWHWPIWALWIPPILAVILTCLSTLNPSCIGCGRPASESLSLCTWKPTNLARVCSRKFSRSFCLQKRNKTLSKVKYSFPVTMPGLKY